MSLTKRDIAKNISLSSTLTLLESSKLLDKFIQKIIVSSKKSNLKLSNFGTFSYKLTPKRVGRNPKTGIEAVITPRRVLSFRPSHILKDRVDGAK